MKFLVDAQLPRRLALEIVKLGGDAIHCLDLPAGNRTSDGDLTRPAVGEQRVMITKDGDFVDSFLLRREPAKLLFITTGNIANNALLHLLRSNWASIESMLQQGDFVELSRTNITLHA